MSFKIVSWYTINTPYKEIINEYLMPSLTKLNIVPAIYPIASLGTWRNNTNLKSHIAKQALKDFDEDILLLDADCKVHEYPQLFDDISEEYDLAVFYLDWNQWYKNGSNKKELCSGTLFIRNRPICHEVIEHWLRISEGEGKIYPDQKNLEKAIKNFGEYIDIYKLPYEYCWINSLPNGHKPYVERPEKVVIEHFQASRTIRKG